MKKVLVIDDSKKNREMAINQLSSLCDVTVVSTFQGGMNAMRIEKFDLVLTDIMLSVGANSPVTNELSLNPSGLVLALYAAGNNIPVCIMTDFNHHHTEAILVAVEELEPLIGNIQYLCHENGKDWRKAFWLMVDVDEISMEQTDFFKGTVIIYGEIQDVPIGKLDFVFSDAVKIALSDVDVVEKVFKARPRNIVVYSDFIQENKLSLLREILSIIQPERQRVQSISIISRQLLEKYGFDIDILFEEYGIEYQRCDVLKLVRG